MRVFALLFALLLAAPAHAQVAAAPIGPTGGAGGLSGHVGSSGAGPTAATCVGFALAAGGTDFSGSITYTSATTCSVNFGTAYARAPACSVTPGTAASTVLVTTTTAAMSVTFGTAQAAFSYICAGL